MMLTKREISSRAAMKLVNDAVAYADKNGLNICVAVVDTSGSVLALQRMDNVSPAIVDFAVDKAYTAANLKSTTASFAERANASESLKLGLATRSRILPWGGGLPIYSEDTIVGAIGVSGAKDFEDIACAEAAVLKFEG
jgi:uncharacterized protein GlcG (DUF336 family)